MPAQRTARGLSPTAVLGTAGPLYVGIRTAPGSCESLAFSGFARGREEDGNRLETLHIVWDGMPWGKGGHSERVPATLSFVRWTAAFRSECRECPSGVLFVIAVELVVCTLGV